MEEQRYEQQKKEEEVEKRFRQDCDNWLAEYKENSKEVVVKPVCD